MGSRQNKSSNPSSSQKQQIRIKQLLNLPLETQIKYWNWYYSNRKPNKKIKIKQEDTQPIKIDKAKYPQFFSHQKTNMNNNIIEKNGYKSGQNKQGMNNNLQLRDIMSMTQENQIKYWNWFYNKQFAQREKQCELKLQKKCTSNQTGSTGITSPIRSPLPSPLEVHRILFNRDNVQDNQSPIKININSSILCKSKKRSG